MREHMQARLTVLRQEFDKGQAEIERIEQQRAYVREGMLRISGAIQVLEELLAEEQPADQASNVPAETQPRTEVNGRRAE
jgi:hypothetical protein